MTVPGITVDDIRQVISEARAYLRVSSRNLRDDRITEEDAPLIAAVLSSKLIKKSKGKLDE